MSGFVSVLERHQVLLYLAAILGATALGFSAPSVATSLAPSITPVLGVLLYITFVSVPVAKVGTGLRDWRFLLTVIGLNFVIVPVVAFALSRIVVSNQALLVGSLLVLLTPCVDYVIVFTRLAGGSADKLLAVTPILLVLQMVLLPLYLGLMAGPEFLTALDPWPFLRAFLLLILLPFSAAALTQALWRNRGGAALQALSHVAMVPCMMLVLFIVVASQVAGVGSRVIDLAAVVPVYVLFVLVLVIVCALVGKWLRLPDPERRALVFSGVTRNSLVVLPLALAVLPMDVVYAVDG